ncbi:MAG: M48 family metallopeptidase [Gammaproteobacteria bacterium]|nr:M48 family metallopeptidase [Gammaproteobacteria bacterium]
MWGDDRSSDLKLDWSLRVSRRARHARLQVKPFGGLEVVIPARFPRHQVAALVDRHAAWARRQLARQASLRLAIRLPDELALAFDNSTTPIIYRDDSPFDAGDNRCCQSIVIDGVDQRARIDELRRYIRRRAQLSLPPLLEQISRSISLEFNRVSIRSQKTRWGSCSNRGNISLNDQLLFLPTETVEYLMIHELCHTHHLNHSRAFWTLVQTHCPGYRNHETHLRKSRNLVPDWFLLSLYA